VTAHEQEQQSVVLFGLAIAVGRLQQLFVFGRFGDQRRLAPPARALGAHMIGDAARGNLNQPSARIVGHARNRPLRGGDSAAPLVRRLPPPQSRRKRRTTAPSTRGISSRSSCTSVCSIRASQLGTTPADFGFWLHCAFAPPRLRLGRRPPWTSSTPARFPLRSDAHVLKYALLRTSRKPRQNAELGGRISGAHYGSTGGALMTSRTSIGM